MTANKILAQVARGLDISGLPAPALIAYLDKLYSNPRYADFDVGIAIELAAMRGIDAQSASSKVPPLTNTGESGPQAVERAKHPLLGRAVWVRSAPGPNNLAHSSFAFSPPREDK
jgi:hypothetical protein